MKISTKCLLVLGITCLVAGCALTPKPLSVEAQQKILQDDRHKSMLAVEPIGSQLSMHEAIARGLKYNLDYRSKMMEQAMALGTYQLSNYDMLPKIVANAGYSYRNNDFISSAKGAYSGNPSLSEPFVSSAREFNTASAGLTWNILDFGVSYINAKQNASRFLAASEKRRRTMHVLIQDIQVAYMRAATARKLSDRIRQTIVDGQEALTNSQKVESQGLRPPIDALRYQKSLLDNLKILKTIEQELATAQTELNQLINVPANSKYEFEEIDAIQIPNTYDEIDIQEFEIRALMHNADLKEGIYVAQIAAEETRKSLLKLLPSLNVSLTAQTTNNSYYINQNWVEAGSSVSLNLWNIVMAPQTMKLAEQGKELAAQKRMAVQMAVVSQVYLAKAQIQAMRDLYNLSHEIDLVDNKIAQIISNKEKEGAASAAERVAADAAAILSRLRKYQALSQFYAASGKLQATTGLEPDIGSVPEIKLRDLTGLIQKNQNQWLSGEWFKPLTKKIEPENLNQPTSLLPEINPKTSPLFSATGIDHQLNNQNFQKSLDDASKGSNLLVIDEISKSKQTNVVELKQSYSDSNSSISKSGGEKIVNWLTHETLKEPQ